MLKCRLKRYKDITGMAHTFGSDVLALKAVVIPYNFALVQPPAVCLHFHSLTISSSASYP